MQARAKIAKVRDALRRSASGQDVIEVPAAILDPVRQYVQQLSALIERADQIIAGLATTWDDAAFEGVPLTQARAAERLLLITLGNIRAAKASRG